MRHHTQTLRLTCFAVSPGYYPAGVLTRELNEAIGVQRQLHSQPRPMAETSGPLVPSERVIIEFLLLLRSRGSIIDGLSDDTGCQSVPATGLPQRRYFGGPAYSYCGAALRGQKSAYLCSGIQERPLSRTNSMSATAEKSTSPVPPLDGSNARSATSPHTDTVP